MIGTKELDEMDIKSIATSRFSRKEFTKKRLIWLWLLPTVLLVALLFLPIPYNRVSYVPFAYLIIKYIWFMLAITKHEKKFLKEWKDN